MRFTYERLGGKECREEETEADLIGIQLAARACFNPESAAEAFRKLRSSSEAQKESLPIFEPTPCGTSAWVRYEPWNEHPVLPLMDNFPAPFPLCSSPWPRLPLAPPSLLIPYASNQEQISQKSILLE